MRKLTIQIVWETLFIFAFGLKHDASMFNFKLITSEFCELRCMLYEYFYCLEWKHTWIR